MNPEAQILREQVLHRIRQTCSVLPPDPALPSFVRCFRDRFGESLLAVIFYGSCLSEVTRRGTSIYDFFLICDRYLPFYRDAKLALLNSWLPPNGYYVELTDSELGTLAGKYCVVSLPHFLQETSPGARDLYHLGRFAKRVAICYTRNDRVHEQLVQAILRAMEQNLSLTLPGMPEYFHQNDFILTLLGMSYRGELRVDIDTKVEELFKAEAEYYRYCYGNLLRAHFLEQNMGSVVMDHVSLPMSRLRRRSHSLRVHLSLSRTRLRAYLRWPKHVVTFPRWVDYLLEKIERSKGIRIELTERERKYPLIFGWKHFFRLKREGMIR